jgi:hypothetical protein
MEKIIEVPQTIKVALTPRSGPEIPQFVLQSFVGVEFPIMDKIPVVSSCPTRISWGYKIDKPTAIYLIRQKSEEAASWIEEHQDIFQKPYLVINEEACLPEDFFLQQTKFK